MNLKNIFLAGASFVAAVAMASSAAATITVGDNLQIDYRFPNVGDIYNSANVVFTGNGQAVGTQYGITTVFLYSDHIVFSETPGCGNGCTQTPASYNGPLVINLSNPTAFTGWGLLSDTVGITGVYNTGDSIGVNWQGAPVQGEAVVGVAVPEPATWALMIGGFGLAGAALRRRRLAVA